jgi:hypothetical protein
MAGESGNDTLQVLGAGLADSIIVSAGTVEAQVVNTADGTTFLTDVEHAVLRLGTGADQIAVNTSTGAKLSKMTIDLRPSPTVSTGDGHPDTISVNATIGADNVSMTGAAGSLTLSGLAPMIQIQGSDYARDTLIFTAVLKLIRSTRGFGSRRDPAGGEGWSGQRHANRRFR